MGSRASDSHPLRLTPKRLLHAVCAACVLGLLASATARGPEPAPRQDFGAFEITADEPEAFLDMALSAAGQGDLDRALETLTEADADSAEPAVKKRILRERGRIGELIRLRLALFENAVANGTKLKLRYEGKPLIAKIKKVENGVVYFDTNKRKLTELKLSEFDIFELVGVMAKAKPKLGTVSLRAYALALSGNDRWKKMWTRDKSKERDRFLGDDVADLAQRQQRGRLVVLMQDLMAFEGRLTEDGVADAALEKITELVEVGRDDPLVKDRYDELQDLATASVELAYNESRLNEILHAKEASLTDGNVRLVYDFSTIEQVQDFLLLEDYDTRMRESMPPLAVSEDDWSFKHEKGELGVLGDFSMKHILPLEAPCKLTYTVKYAEPAAAGDSGPVFILLATLCDNIEGSRLAMINHGDLVAHDIVSRKLERKRVEDHQIMPHREYIIEIANDGKEFFTCSIDGEKKNEVPICRRTFGFSAFFVYSDMKISFMEITIEGKIGSKVRRDLKAIWADTKLEALGF